MVQLVSPNLDTVGNVGWCLKFVEDAYNTPHLGATATDAWQATEFPHEDVASIPSDVAVPVWFSYYENGINYGHVAINVPNRGVLSSPYKRDNTQVWFTSLNQCEQVLNCKYVGWSEDLATVRLVKPEENEMPIADRGFVINRFKQIFNRVPSEAEIAVYVGQPHDVVYDALLNSDEFKGLLNGDFTPYQIPNLFIRSSK